MRDYFDKAHKLIRQQAVNLGTQEPPPWREDRLNELQPAQAEAWDEVEAWIDDIVHDKTTPNYVLSCLINGIGITEDGCNEYVGKHWDG